MQDDDGDPGLPAPRCDQGEEDGNVADGGQREQDDQRDDGGQHAVQVVAAVVGAGTDQRGVHGRGGAYAAKVRGQSLNPFIESALPATPF